MKLYLFGGAETHLGQAPILKKLINKVLREIKPKQLLHIPYARIKVSEKEKNIWGEGWLKRDLDLKGIEILDARKKDQLQKAKNPVIFMNGGHQRDLLYQKITTNKVLHNLVMNADFIIGESAGSMVNGEFRRTDKNGKEITVKGLGILKETVIEAHYTEKNRRPVLIKEMKETGAKYGIGIDSITGIVVDTNTYPEKYEIIGEGSVEFIR